MPQFSGLILLSTAAANIGIDNHLVTFVLDLGWTRDSCTYFQQRGQCGSDPDVIGECTQVGDVQSYVHQMYGIYNKGNDTLIDTASDALVRINSAITSLKKKPTTRVSKEKKKGDLRTP